jgi:hypothetical protein
VTWKDYDEFILWRCPRCLVRGWTMEPNGHVPSSHFDPQGGHCHAIPETLLVRKVGEGEDTEVKWPVSDELRASMTP